MTEAIEEQPRGKPIVIILSITVFACTFGTFLFYQIVHNESFGLGTEFFPEIIEVLFGIGRYIMFLGRYVIWGICLVLTLFHLAAIANSEDQQRLLLNGACILLNGASAYFCYWAYLENMRS